MGAERERSGERFPGRGVGTLQKNRGVGRPVIGIDGPRNAAGMDDQKAERAGAGQEDDLFDRDAQGQNGGEAEVEPTGQLDGGKTGQVGRTGLPEKEAPDIAAGLQPGRDKVRSGGHRGRGGGEKRVSRVAGNQERVGRGTAQENGRVQGLGVFQAHGVGPGGRARNDAGGE